MVFLLDSFLLGQWSSLLIDNGLGCNVVGSSLNYDFIAYKIIIKHPKIEYYTRSEKFV